ncbi:MAG: hypothetical protein EPN38_12000 [Rhodanobacteraceae bacterium]|nr:MAG: hypothetical protein EPN38_12000 [Rhodanobacteraceae bacterium]
MTSAAASSRDPAGPEQPRPLGRSRTYTAQDLPARLRQWHAPRVNRWERVCVLAGTVAIEYLGAGGVAGVTLAAGASRWMASGVRWRVAAMDAGGRFEIGVHAGAKGQAEAPQPLRSRLLDAAPRAEALDRAGLQRCLQALPVGARCIIRLRFADNTAPAVPGIRGHFFWHPLAAHAGGSTALVARAGQAFGLADYLGRDHAVIEAALGGALVGDSEADRWLHATLERHLHIEERLIFPAYLAAGGASGWVQGLLNEHGYLREYLAAFGSPEGRRKFLRLLDAHDEKEEGTVYPDVLAHLGARAEGILAKALAWPAPAVPR